MKEFSVIIFADKTGQFTTSFSHPLTQKRIRNTFKTREEAKRNKEEIERKFTKRQFNDYMGLTVGELLNLFMLEVPNNNLLKYSKLHLTDFAETFSDYKIEALTSDVLKVWLDQIQEENKLKDISLRKIKCDFDGFFKFLVEKEIISKSPLTSVYYERVPIPVYSRNILSEAEINHILNAALDFSPGYLYPLLRMFVETGAKSTEVADLTWKDIDLEKRLVKFKQTTTSRERTLEISDELAQLLSKKKSKQGYIFLTYYGESFTKCKLGRAITEFKVKSKFEKNWCCSDFRHSFAVHFLSKGRSLNELQYILGHSHVQQTKQLYGEVTKRVIAKNPKNLLDPYTATSS